MITKTNKTWLRTLFTVSGTSLRNSWPRIVLATLVAVVVTVVELHWGLQAYTLSVAPFTILGVAISIFLVFRNNTAYNRFWEGRILWGGLVNISRSFARQVITLISVTDTDSGRSNGRSYADQEMLTAFQNKMVYRAIAFVHALRHHLRDTNPETELNIFLSPEEVAYTHTQNNRPFAILQLIGQQIQEARRERWIQEYHVPVLEGSLSTMTDILGACERIKNTPVPFTYTVLSHRLVAFFCFFLPFGIVDTVGIFTPFMVFLVSHAFFGLDVIGEEIEDPFGTDPHHLPLAALCRTIEINLRQIIGETQVPKPIVPQDGILL
jgi:ion channel-forming bestrophin family protein